MDPYDHHHHHHLSSYQQHQDILVQQQQNQKQNQQFNRAEDMLRQHSGLGSSSNHSGTGAATTIANVRLPHQPDLQVLPPPGGTMNRMHTSNTSSTNHNPFLSMGGVPINNSSIPDGGHSRHKDLQMDMMNRLTMHSDMQQKLAAVTQQQRRRSSGGLLNSRVALARELGISESQLSLMSEFSTISSAISGLGSTLTVAPMGEQPVRSGRSMAAAAMAGDLDFATSLLHQSSAYLLNSPSYQQQQQPGTSFSFRNTTSANMAAEAAAAVNSSDMDRRRVFAKMKYSRPPSVRSVKGTGQSQQGVSIQSMDDLPDFNMVDSNLSLFSLSSKMSNLDMKPAATTAFEPNHANAYLPHHNNAYGHPHQHHDVAFGASTTHQPFLQKVIVESALSNRSDFLTAGSRHSIMSGLSKISDSSIDNSIFSDLSRKIGNVSTRSVAMSEMSVMDVQDMMEDLGDPRSDTPYGMPTTGDHRMQPVFSPPQQRKQAATSTTDFDMLR
jgi:hypothetical protein